MKGARLILWILLSWATVAQAQIVIPLQVYSQRLGIQLQLGTNPQVFDYVFDTGSVALLAASGTTSFWDGTFETSSTNAFNIQYSGTTQYIGVAANTTVTFQTTTGSSVRVSNATVGDITSYPNPTWADNVNNPSGPQPTEDSKFYGTFGAGLNFTGNNGYLTSILSQIPIDPSLKRGFIVQVTGTTATLTVGLSQSAIESFTTLIPMTTGSDSKTSGTHTNDNGTVAYLHPEAQATGTITIIDGTTTYQKDAGIIMDTGGLDTHITTGSDLDPSLSLVTGGIVVPGASFSASVSGTIVPGTSNTGQPLDWIINPTGTTAYGNQVAVEAGTSLGTLNTGLPFFSQYTVMFDAEDGVIGLIAVPEPSSGALVLAALGGFAVMRYRRRNA